MTADMGTLDLESSLLASGLDLDFKAALGTAATAGNAAPGSAEVEALADSLVYSQTVDAGCGRAKPGEGAAAAAAEGLSEQLGALERWVEDFAASRLRDQALARRAAAASRFLEGRLPSP